MDVESIRHILVECGKKQPLTELMDGLVHSVKLTDFVPNSQNNIEFVFKFKGVWKGEEVNNKTIRIYRLEREKELNLKLHYALLWLEKRTLEI